MEQKIKDAICTSIILTPIMFGVFAIANAFFYYTMVDTSALYIESTGSGMTINQIPGGYAVSAINDTEKSKPSNITTVLQNLEEKDNELVVEFNHTTSQQGLEIDYFQCKIDNINWGECSSPYVLKLSDFDRNSNHTLEIRAIDMNGNAEANPVAILFPLNEIE